MCFYVARFGQLQLTPTHATSASFNLGILRLPTPGEDGSLALGSTDEKSQSLLLALVQLLGSWMRSCSWRICRVKNRRDIQLGHIGELMRCFRGYRHAIVSGLVMEDASC